MNGFNNNKAEEFVSYLKGKNEEAKRETSPRASEGFYPEDAIRVFNGQFEGLVGDALTEESFKRALKGANEEIESNKKHYGDDYSAGSTVAALEEKANAALGLKKDAVRSF